MKGKKVMNEQEIKALKTQPGPFSIDLNDAESFIVEVQNGIECASCIMQDITESYLGRSDIQEDDYWRLKAGYNEYSIKAQIVWDYILKLQELGNKANSKIKALYKTSRYKSD